MNNNFNTFQLTEEIENTEEIIIENEDETTDSGNTGDDQKGDIEINLIDAN